MAATAILVRVAEKTEITWYINVHNDTISNMTETNLIILIPESQIRNTNFTCAKCLF